MHLHFISWKCVYNFVFQESVLDSFFQVESLFFYVSSEIEVRLFIHCLGLIDLLLVLLLVISLFLLFLQVLDFVGTFLLNVVSFRRCFFYFFLCQFVFSCSSYEVYSLLFINIQTICWKIHLKQGTMILDVK